MLLKKTLPLRDVDLKMDGESGRFAGYASVFNGVDSQGDTILPGAFAETLKTHGMPKMFWNHDWLSMPIGKWTVAKEDDKGLYVEGELTPGLELAKDVHAALKHGTLDGLSIGGYLRGGDYEETDSGRIIHRWTHLVEISPVVFPADEAARIDLATVRADILAQIKHIETIRDLERFLREAGFGKRAAAALVARAKDILQGEPAKDAEAKALAEIASRLHRLAARN